MSSLDVGGGVALAAAGLVGGFVNAIAGGGSLIVFPTLIATGLGTVPANVTNSVALWPGYIGTLTSLRDQVITQWRHEPRRLLVVNVVAVLGTVLGALLLLITPAAAFNVVVPVLVLGATALLAAGPRLKARRRSNRSRDSALYGATFVAGTYGGYFGGGLGVILLAMLGLTYAGDLRAQNAVKALLQLVVSTAALIVFVLGGPIDWIAVAVIAPTALIGGFVGGRLTRVISEVWLRRIVVTFGVAVGVWLIVRAVRGD